jgi:hypothetical protein
MLVCLSLECRVDRDTVARALIVASGAILADQVGYWQSWQFDQMLSLRHHEGIALAVGALGLLLRDPAQVDINRT